MKTLLYLTSLTLLFLGACSENQSNENDSMNNEEQALQTSDEWMMLFDGESTRGWRNYGSESIGDGWKVEDGNLYLDLSKGEDGKRLYAGGDIVSDDEFENFHLKLEWKISENGNSGIMFYVKEDKSKYPYPWSTGPEMQILDNDGHPDGKIRTHRAGDLYDLIEVSEETVKPVGEWNLAEIVSENGNLQFWLNGKKVVETTMWDEAWTEMIAGSKFKSMPDFGTFQKGRIALQDHGDPVWFRNIMIKKL